MRDYLAKANTTSVNGIFILIVFLNHFQSYVAVPKIYRWFILGIGQLMVAMFLFYSGYGVGESIQKKGMAYVKSIPVKRVGKVLSEFALAVLLFALVDVILGIGFTPSQFFLSLVGWKNLGNSNWYIFVILCLYLFTWLGFLLFPKSPWKSFAVICLLTALLFLFLQEKKVSWWYNTLTAYPFGLLFSLTKKRWEKWLEQPVSYGIILISSLAVTVLLRTVSRYVPAHLCMTVSYCIFILAVTKKVPVYHPILWWLGNHLFEIYILMRIPMIILKRGFAALSLSLAEPAVLVGYFLLCLALTLIMAAGYHFLMQKMEQCFTGKTLGES